MCDIIIDCKAFWIYTRADGEKMADKHDNKLEIILLYDIYAPLLSDKQRDTLDLYLNEDLSLGEIAESTDVTRQAVMNCIRKGEQRLTELESAMGLARRFNEITKRLDKLTEAHPDSETAAMISEIKELL